MSLNDVISQYEEELMVFDIVKDNVDVLIDDSPEKLNDFKTKSVTGGTAICYKQTWNAECHNDYISIDKLSDIMTKVFG